MTPSAIRFVGASNAVNAAPAGRAAPAYPHLVALFVAVVASLAAGAALSWYAQRTISLRLYDLIAVKNRQMNIGLAVQREALKRADIVPLFGSSEVDRGSPNHPRQLFAAAPDGFSVIPIARDGLPIFLTLQDVAALGRDLRGKKVAVLLSPGMFGLLEGDLLRQRYAGTFSPLHALTMLLSDDLSPALKQRLAARMLKRPALLERSSELSLVTRAVADDSWLARMRLAVFMPLVAGKRSLLEFHDRMLVLWRLLQPMPRIPRPDPRPLDWPARLGSAHAAAQAESTGNPWGVDATWWGTNHAWVDTEAHADSDRMFLDRLAASESRLDLEQLLQVFQELGAHPLIMSMPFDGRLWDLRGVSSSARNEYYALVHNLADRYHVQAMLFEDREREPYFFFDLWSHPSGKGWIYLDQAIDDFVHDARR